MISQHLQTATLGLGVSWQPSTEGIALNAIAELQDFIALRPDAREVRKALAVKLVYQGYLYDEIQTILEVSRGSITGWILLMNRMELTDCGLTTKAERVT